MQRLLAFLAMYKFAVLLSIYFAMSVLDPVAVVSIIVTAIASLVSSISREPEVFVIIIPLIMLVDVVGLILAISSLAGITGAAPGDVVPFLAFYLVAIAWDSEVLRLSRAISA